MAFATSVPVDASVFSAVMVGMDAQHQRELALVWPASCIWTSLTQAVHKAAKREAPLQGAPGEFPLKQQVELTSKVPKLSAQFERMLQSLLEIRGTPAQEKPLLSGRMED